MKWPVPVFYVIIACLAVSCVAAPGTAPAPEPAAVEPAAAEPAVPPVEEPVRAPVVYEEAFNPAAITQKEFDAAIFDIRQFISDLNRIVRARNYDSWVAHLSPSYFAQVSSPEFLFQISQRSDRLKARGIVISSARDYFLQVVVPSRANDRVDDIEFVSHRRIKAFTVNSKGQRLRLYDLERVEDGWRIIN
jgi:hypothetical protein